MIPLCRHFGICGGCTFQDMSPDAYRAMKRAEVGKALAIHGVEAPIGDLLETAPAKRRRTALRAVKDGDEVRIGFNGLRSHAVVDMHECFVLTPALLALVQELRALLRRLLKSGERAEIAATETDSGFDLLLDFPRGHSARDTAVLAQWADARKIARISLNGDVVVQFAGPAIRVGAAEVALPNHAFLQPSREGEQILQAAVLEIVQGARRVADLFAGCGTFALLLALRARVHAVDQDAEALDALAKAAGKTGGLKPVTSEVRDLFKRPLRPEELNGFDAVVIDPPRAGAHAQVRLLAQSRVRRIAYVSCNPDTFGRDAAILTKGGFHLTGVRPVDQFLWSKHIELVGEFERKPGWSQRRKN